MSKSARTPAPDLANELGTATAGPIDPAAHHRIRCGQHSEPRPSSGWFSRWSEVVVRAHRSGVPF
jgi:hypothetical protein